MDAKAFDYARQIFDDYLYTKCSIALPEDVISASLQQFLACYEETRTQDAPITKAEPAKIDDMQIEALAILLAGLPSVKMSARYTPSELQARPIKTAPHNGYRYLARMIIQKVYDSAGECARHSKIMEEAAKALCVKMQDDIKASFIAALRQMKDSV